MFDLSLLKEPSFKAEHSSEEWFDIYNDNKEPIGSAPRSVCHSYTFLLHKVVHVLVFNSRGELLLQKRSRNKLIQPCKWDTSVGGHVAEGETIDIALLRETKEELGIDIKENTVKFLYDYIMRSEIEQEWVFTFSLIYDGLIQFQKEEIEQVRFWTVDRIKEKMQENIFTPNFIDELNRFLTISRSEKK